MVATCGHLLEKRNQKGRSSTASKTAIRKQKMMQTTRRSTKSGWKRVSDLQSSMLERRLDSLQREGILGLSRVIKLEDRVVAGCFTSIK